MPGLRDALRKVKSLIIEEDPNASTSAEDIGKLFEQYGGLPEGMKTAEQATVDTPGPALEEVRIDPQAGAAAFTEAGLDFPHVYAAAGLPETPFTVEQAIEMINAFPPNMPMEMKKQSLITAINSMGKALGVTAETIVADCTRKLAALHAYVEKIDRDTSGLVETAQSEIAKLEAQIDERRKTIQEAQTRREATEKACDAEADRIDNLFDYLGTPAPGAPSAPSEPGGHP
jgi:hypothetical protein